MAERRCRVCGCTWNNACLGGCYWAGPDLCSACVGVDAASHSAAMLGRPGAVLAHHWVDATGRIKIGNWRDGDIGQPHRHREEKALLARGCQVIRAYAHARTPPVTPPVQGTSAEARL